MSRFKELLRCIEGVAILWCVAGMIVAASVAMHLVEPASVQAVVGALVAGVFALFGLAVLLTAEFLAVVRHGQSWRRMQNWMSGTELMVLVMWCPGSVLVASLALIVFGLAFLVTFGEVQWSSGSEFTERHVIGFSLGAAWFSVVGLPVFASASRMPGAYKDLYGAKRTTRT
jgi:hypothetical protein